jgi:UDP-N-acetyl-D-glucosamine dehydrogenase
LVEKIAVIGQGYVGLPLAITAAEAGFFVVGIDIDSEKVSLLSKGVSTVEDVSNERLLVQLQSKNYTVSTEFSVISEVEIILICVPTPLDSNQKPDLSYIKNSVEQIANHLKPDSLVILESTVEPGTTRNMIQPSLEKASNSNPNTFHLAFSPERIDPTNKKWNLVTTPKIVAGMTTAATKRAVNFYSKFIDTVIECSVIEIAESAKLLENTFRLINISFINEFSVFCSKLGIDVREVIKAAATKPYGFMPFYPSIGVGGHCIPVDPLYLSNKALEIGAPTRFIDLADQINQEMPGYFVGKAEEKLGGLKNKNILVLGVAYKPNVADVRETPVEALISGLKKKGAQVSWNDELVKEWNGEKSVTLSDDFDLAIIATPHDYLDLTKLGNVPILNTRGSI